MQWPSVTPVQGNRVAIDLLPLGKRKTLTAMPALVWGEPALKKVNASKTGREKPER